MKTEQIFPELIVELPEADIPIHGVKAFLSQGVTHQIIFMEFSGDVDISEHFHERGRIYKQELPINSPLSGLSRNIQVTGLSSPKKKYPIKLIDDEKN
jgi:hypothetical protein